jgi:uncharacterized membrane protein
VTPARVWAQSAQATRGYRRAWALERLRDSFWPAPALLLAVGVTLAALTVNAARLGIPAVLLRGPRVDPGETSSVLGIIASSTLTFLGVVFTLSLVALQLASSQLSPRVVRMFVRSSVTKLAFGILLCAFSYSVAFLVLEGGHHNEADSRGLAVSMGLVTASLIVFLGYVASTMRLLQVAWVITRVADETRGAIARQTPADGQRLQAAAPELTVDPVIVRLSGRGKSLGVVQGVDHRRLVRLAERHDCVLQLLVRVGEYVPTGGSVFAVHARATSGGPATNGRAGGKAAANGVAAGELGARGLARSRALLAGINLGRTRTLYQDPSFGLRQLVDIASQALSPAINQPTTAVHVIDRLEDVVMRLGRQAELTGYYADQAGTVRFVEPVMTWEDVLDLAFVEITSYGAGSVQVARRLLATYDALEAGVIAARRPAVAARRSVLLQDCADQGVAGSGLRADALGLG